MCITIYACVCVVSLYMSSSKEPTVLFIFATSKVIKAHNLRRCRPARGIHVKHPNPCFCLSGEEGGEGREREISHRIETLSKEESGSSNFRFTGARPTFRILGEAYATWREPRRGAEGHAGGWMWFRGSWEGKRGHPSMGSRGGLYACRWTFARWRRRLIPRREHGSWLAKGLAGR